MYTEEQVNIIAQKAAEEAVKRYAIMMGIEVDDPRDMQADMIFIRNLRKLCETAGNKVVLVIIGTIVLALCAIVGKSLIP